MSFWSFSFLYDKYQLSTKLHYVPLFIIIHWINYAQQLHVFTISHLRMLKSETFHTCSSKIEKKIVWKFCELSFIEIERCDLNKFTIFFSTNDTLWPSPCYIHVYSSLNWPNFSKDDEFWAISPSVEHVFLKVKPPMYFLSSLPWLI